MKTWQVVVHHDDGIINIFVTGMDEASVRKAIIKAEGCPESAIRKVKCLGSVYHTIKTGE